MLYGMVDFIVLNIRRNQQVDHIRVTNNKTPSNIELYILNN